MPALAVASCVVERARRRWSRLLPPRGLQARLRWIFVLVSLVVQLATAAQLVLQPHAPDIEPWSLAALGLLALMHLVSYRRGRVIGPLVDALLESSLVGLATLGGADLRTQLWLYFQTLERRALDGTWPHVGGAVICQSAAFAAVATAWPLAHGAGPSPLNDGELFGYSLGFVMAGVLIHAISTAAARHERGAARERSLAQAGSALVGASNRAEVYTAALDAVTDLLAGIPVSLVALSVRDGTTTTIVAARGPQAEALLGLSRPLAELPAPARLAPAQRQHVIDESASTAVQAALGFPLRRCVATLTQLRVKSTHLGTLIVESPTRLPTETADGLATLAAEIALALDSARLTEHLHQLAYHDPLTGLANRGRFVECLEQAVAHAREQATTLAVLYLDLDDFKIINDSLGHAAGDELLCTVAERLRTCVRDEDDLVARLGGDEFTVLLEDVAGPDAASAIAQRIADELRRCVELHGRSLTVGGSVGIALWQPMSLVASDAGDLLRAADLALYAAKAGGKGQVAMFEPAMSAQALERLELEADLRQGLAAGDFEVYYQPLVAFESGAVQAVEALVRWNHPQRGTVGPAAFIGLAEETGLIVELGRWVLETACRDVRRWQQRYPSPTPLQVNVNLSARQLRDPHLVDDVRHILATSGLDPASLKLEITESVAIADTVQNEQTLARLRQLGIRLAIDDFGTGNSAMDYLRRFPIDTLKIDRSFIEQLGREERSTALVRGMVAFAKSLGLHVTGEGVETAEQSAQLHAMGCDLGQGYLFARPIPAAQLEATLRAAALPRPERVVARAA